MKTILKIILIVIISGIILILGFSGFIMYQSSSSEKIIEEKYHPNGKLALQIIEGYDCCEGFFEKTINYDIAGQKIEVFGNQNGSRFKEIYRYYNSNLIFEGYYTIDNDSLTDNFKVENAKLSFYIETKYHRNKRIKSKKRLSFYEDWNKRDTASFELEEYDTLGSITINREFRKDRDYFWDEKQERDTMIIQMTVIEDKLKK